MTRNLNISLSVKKEYHDSQVNRTDLPKRLLIACAFVDGWLVHYWLIYAKVEISPRACHTRRGDHALLFLMGGLAVVSFRIEPRYDIIL